MATNDVTRLDERYNPALVNTLAKFAQKDHHTWDKKVSELVYVYNTTACA